MTSLSSVSNEINSLRYWECFGGYIVGRRWASPDLPVLQFELDRGMSQGAGKARANGGDFKWLGWLLGFIVSTFSIATLVHYGVVTGDLSRPVEALIDAYHDAIGIVLGPVEQLLSPWLRWLGSIVGWDIQLYPHWRHILMLSLVFWLAWARAYWNVNNRKAAAVVVVGLTFSVAGALAAGALRPGSTNEVLIFVLPVAASFLSLEFMIAITAIVPKVRFLNLWFLAFFFGLAALIYFAGPAIASALSGPNWAVRSPALLVLGLAVVLLALGGLILGAVLTLFGRLPSRGRIAALRQNPDFRVGVIMLGGFIGTAILFAVDAALRLSTP
ncbi:MAG: hypothetical protein Q8R02_23740 [Hyphomonadaceae bacterium]|nr:hypothetical protein [Hyphomonadaceae bacterium]